LEAGDMNQEVDTLMNNVYVSTLAYFSVAAVALLVFLFIFNLITRYNDWDEIKKGNVAVAMATSGKIFGICNLFRFAILNNDTILESVAWASFGFALLLVAYYLFELLTPHFKIDEEIKNGNKAVGLISMVLSISISYVIGASVA
jgi:putative membrane protein